MKIIGIDLSGPSNHKDTVIATFQESNGRLAPVPIGIQVGASDSDILNIVNRQAADDAVVIGIDSPLSYQDGGGDRPFDKELRNFSKDLGMKPGSIMTPTMTRMIYLTVRGIHLSHLLSAIPNVKEIVEVHPGTALASRVSKDEIEYALSYKKNAEDLRWVEQWLAHYFSEVALNSSASHEVDAYLAALAAWHWASEDHTSPWSKNAVPPHHPFPITC
ncbi:DUF429 domain-containing protein [Halobacillus fulvus]|nr:DUF429 domain-containing protein [Halobacillus fulvus]